MRITWANERFEAEFTPGEQWLNDLDAVKIVGFRTDGPPTWVWHTSKVSVLNKLRKKKPASGLIITEFALQQYNSLNVKEEAKAALKKTYTKLRKKANEDSAETIGQTYWGAMKKGYLDASDLPAYVSTCVAFVKPEPPSDICFECGEPIYFYEYPDTCIWCK